MLRSSLAPVLGFMLFACGGGAAPAATPTATSAAPAASAAPASTAAPAAKAQTAEDQRADFMGSCMDQPSKKDYCDCGFEQFKVLFKDADFSKPLADDDPRIAQLTAETSKACANKLPESDIRQSFQNSCVEGDTRKAAYCECAWTSLRKTVPYTAFLGEAALSDARGVEARKAMATDCKGKFPADIAQKDFMDACAKGATGSDAVCKCRWAKLSKQFSTEQIVAGTADVTTVKGLKECKDAH